MGVVRRILMSFGNVQHFFCRRCLDWLPDRTSIVCSRVRSSSSDLGSSNAAIRAASLTPYLSIRSIVSYMTGSRFRLGIVYPSSRNADIS